MCAHQGLLCIVNNIVCHDFCETNIGTNYTKLKLLGYTYYHQRNISLCTSSDRSSSWIQTIDSTRNCSCDSFQTGITPLPYALHHINVGRWKAHCKLTRDCWSTMASMPLSKIKMIKGLKYGRILQMSFVGEAADKSNSRAQASHPCDVLIK